MADNKIIDTKFIYKGVEYSIFCKWKNIENNTEDDAVIKKVYGEDSVSIYNRDTKKYLVASIDRLILHPFGEKGGGRGRSGRFKFDATEAERLLHCSGWTLYYKKIGEKFVNKLVKDKETASNKGDWDAIKGDILTSVGLKWNKSDQTFEKWGAALTTQQQSDLCDVLKKYYTSTQEQPKPAEEKRDGLTLKEIEAMSFGDSFTSKQFGTSFVIKEVDSRLEGIRCDVVDKDGNIYPSSYYPYYYFGERIDAGEVYTKGVIPVPESKPAPKPTETPTPDKGNEIFKIFDTPQQLSAFRNGQLASQKINVLSQIEAMLEGLEANKRDSDFISKQLPNRIWFADPITGDAFVPNIHKDKKFKRADLSFCLSTILRIGGIPASIQEDIIIGVAVHVDGEVNYEENIAYYKGQKDEDGNEYGEERMRSGGLLTELPWYALNNAIEIARNFINNTFSCSFKYPEFTADFKKLLNEKEVQYEDLGYKGEVEIITATCYYKDFGDGKWMYILSHGGYAAMNCNDFLLGYNFMLSMVSKNDYLLAYVKDVEGFIESLMNSSRMYPQLIEKYPEIFGQRKPEPAPEVVEVKTYSIEQDIADLECLLSLESDPIEYAKLKAELDDVKFLKSLS